MEYNVDKELIKRIQPQGGISFDNESYIRTGTGYEACIHVYKLKNSLEENWLTTLALKENTVVSMDLFTLDKEEVKINVNKSIQEQQSREDYAQNYRDYYDAVKRKQELQLLYDEVSSYNEVIKLVQIRIFVHAMTKKELEDRVEKIINGISDYKSAVFLNETENEWISQYLPYEKQLERFSFEGLPVKSQAFADGNPFYDSSLSDPNGNYMGATPTGGSVIYDEFYKSQTRLSYSGVLIGVQRSGKSTFLKKRFKANAMKGNFVRCFDVVGDFELVTKEYAGKYIPYDGTCGQLNWLEIMHAGENEQINYMLHVSKVKAIYMAAKMEYTIGEMNSFNALLDILYEKFKLNPIPGRKIAGLEPEKYPTLSDFIDVTLEEMEKLKKGKYLETEMDLIKKTLSEYADILGQLKTMQKTYGNIFDGHSTIESIKDEQIVTFGLKNVKNLENNIFTAILINLLSLSWDNCVINGQVMKDKWEAGQIEWEDIVRFIVLIDESHEWVNTSKPEVLDILNHYLREAPKFFGSILFASHSIRDFFPSMDGVGAGAADVTVINKLKNLFELTQYKIIFHQESSALPMLDIAFANTLTVSQKNQIPTLGQGECILCIANEHNIRFKVFLTEREEKIFAGGA